MVFTLLFPPDFGGGASRAMNIVKCLLNIGHEVQVVSSVPHYPEGVSISKALRFYRENIEGAEVIRLPTPGLPHKGIFNRFIIYTWYALFSFLALTFCRGTKKVISLGPHPFVDVPSYIVKVATRSSLTVDIADLWPETVDFKGRITNYLFQNIGYFMNKVVLRFFSQNISVYNERALDFIIKNYYYDKKAVIIYNAVDTKSFVYDNKLKLRKENLKALCNRHIEDKFIVLYHGMIGAPHFTTNVIKAASLEERELGKALFIIVGEGEGKEKILELVHDMNLKNVVVVRKLDRSIIKKIVAESDMGIVPIVSEKYLTVYVAMPLKSAEFLATGTPILAPKRSFIGSIVSASSAGFEVDFSDPRNIYEAIKASFHNVKLHKIMCRHARKLAEERFSFDQITRGLRDII